MVQIDHSFVTMGTLLMNSKTEVLTQEATPSFAKTNFLLALAKNCKSKVQICPSANPPLGQGPGRTLTPVTFVRRVPQKNIEFGQNLAQRKAQRRRLETFFN